MKCISLDCEYCYRADFQNSMLVCHSQNKTFRRDTFDEHECTIWDEIKCEQEELNKKIEYATWLESQQK